MNLKEKIINLDKKNKIKILKTTTKVIKKLELGKIFVSEFKKKKWYTNYWIKKAILMYIKNKDSFIIKNNFTNYFDKFRNKFRNKVDKSIRVSEGAVVREGSYIGKKSVLMPSFINVGAYIGKNTMIDSWATIGSCAHIGNNVHISGGVGIGGVLEPLQNSPVIIEDNCFIGARSEIVEGIVIKKNCVISMGVYIGKSTKIFNKTKNKFIKNFIIPKNSVVIPGSINKGFYSTYAAIIIKKKDKNTIKKTKINKTLR
ncbi:2,3,4,5-tetrahydropyridine-2,6-dicarboxylate N-succinyltransferase [Candidatus Vidania fulgoroideorum]